MKDGLIFKAANNKFANDKEGIFLLFEKSNSQIVSKKRTEN